jgi:hypothetical protein
MRRGREKRKTTDEHRWGRNQLTMPKVCLQQQTQFVHNAVSRKDRVTKRTVGNRQLIHNAEGFQDNEEGSAEPPMNTDGEGKCG